MIKGWTKSQAFNFESPPKRKPRSGISFFVDDQYFERIIEACKFFNVNRDLYFDRKKRGWTTEQIFGVHTPPPKKKPNAKQMKNLLFALNVCRYVKSNAIVLAANETTAGIGSGQPSRLDSCEIAINKMNKFFNSPDEIVAASDAFFPFVDSIEKLVQSGVSAIIQPEGSIRDKEIIKFANSTDIALVFSKTRHFRH